MASWNFTIDDASSVVNYKPYGDGKGTANGWAGWYSTSGFNEEDGQASVGDSQHVTTLPGASFELDFYGNAIFVYGSCNVTYAVQLDNFAASNTNPTDELLYYNTTLLLGTHHLSVTLSPGDTVGQMVFDQALITTLLGDGLQAPMALVVDNSNISVLQYDSSWFSSTDHQIHNGQPYRETKTQGSTVTMTFKGSGIAVNGARNWGHWNYEVAVDGGAPSTYNGSTFWLIPDSLLYYQGNLSPDDIHIISIKDVSDSSFTFGLNSVTVYQTNSTSPPTAEPNIGLAPPLSTSSTAPSGSPNPTSVAGRSSSKAGMIAGPIVAVVAVIAIIAGFLWRKRRRNRVIRPLFLDAEVDPFPVENGYHTPYSADPMTTFTAENASTSAFSTEKRAFMESAKTSPAVSVYDHGVTPRGTYRSPSWAATPSRTK